MEAVRPPAPAKDTGLPPGVRVGALGRRFGAYVIDSVVPAAAVVLISGPATGPNGTNAVLVVVAALVAAAWALVCWQQLAVKAATPGMRAAKLQLVGFYDGRPVGWGRVFLRWLVYQALSATGLGLVLLLVSVLVSPRRQGWHDRAASAVVIAQRPLAPPRPATQSRPAVSRPAPAPIDAPVAGDTALPTEALAGADSPSDTVAAPVARDATRRRSILDGWVAELDDGREIPVRGLVLLGRNPQPGEGEDDATLVKLSDESRTVSKTHLALGVDDAGLFVVDRGSTNGSTITPPGQATVHAGPFHAISVAEGSVVSIGDHWVRIRREGSG